MFNDNLSLNNYSKKYSKESDKNSKELIKMELKVEGYNEDIVESYHWLLNFPYYTGKAYGPIKLEDYHYFSENSQFATQIRQIKGGSIQAFQQNLQQLVQLVKIHLIPLLKEIKQADFYYTWFNKIVEFDNLVQEELKKPQEKQNKENLIKYRSERNEAISHIKDKWVMEVDGGRMWQMNKSATEQGLDYALLPQLFFGTNLDNPLYEMHKQGKSIKEQLDEDIYSIDITVGAKEQVARFMYRFYLWLPTAIKDTQITFKLKLSALKQFYAQLQMYIQFMKPLLIEISKKTESFDKNNIYKDFETENPEFINLFDFSYMFIRILGIREFLSNKRGSHKIENLEFTPFGLFVGDADKSEIAFGKYANSKGFITKDLGGKYEFFPSDKKDILREEFNKIKPVEIPKDDLKVYPVMEFEIMQKRRLEVIQTGQGGLQQVPYMSNNINFIGYCWNIFEIATYREKLKQDNLKLLETFIDEVAIMRDDLLYYLNYFEGGKKNDISSKKNEIANDKKKEEKNRSDYTLILGPFQAIGEMIQIFMPNLKLKSEKKHKSEKVNDEKKKHYLIAKLSTCEDTWKLYTIYKKTHQLMQY